jgi:hypothetical protein
MARATAFSPGVARVVVVQRESERRERRRGRRGAIRRRPEKNKYLFPSKSVWLTTLRSLVSPSFAVKMATKDGSTFFFTSESVNEGHPDKLADQVRARSSRLPADLSLGTFTLHSFYILRNVCFVRPSCVFAKKKAGFNQESLTSPFSPPLFFLLSTQISDGVLDACLAQDPDSKVRAQRRDHGFPRKHFFHRKWRFFRHLDFFCIFFLLTRFRSRHTRSTPPSHLPLQTSRSRARPAPRPAW